MLKASCAQANETSFRQSATWSSSAHWRIARSRHIKLSSDRRMSTSLYNGTIPVDVVQEGRERGPWG